MRRAEPSYASGVFVEHVAGVRLQVGTAGPAFGQPGGWAQAQLLERIPLSSWQGSAAPMTSWFSVHNGRLQVTCDDPSFEWEGLLDGLPVLDLISLPSGASAVVLLDPPAGSTSVRNLVGVASDARVAWRAELPVTGESDAFVGMEIVDDGVVCATTWSGYRVFVSPDTGAVLRQEFTK